MNFSQILSNVNKTHIIVAVVIILLIIVVMYIYSKTKSRSSESFGKTTQESQKPKLVLYYASWCSHSRQFINDAWASFLEYANNNLKNVIDIEMVKCENEKQQYCKQLGIPGFPTIILYANGKTIPFDLDRSKDNLIRFVKHNIGSS